LLARIPFTSPDAEPFVELAARPVHPATSQSTRAESRLDGAPSPICDSDSASHRPPLASQRAHPAVLRSPAFVPAAFFPAAFFPLTLAATPSAAGTVIEPPVHVAHFPSEAWQLAVAPDASACPSSSQRPVHDPFAVEVVLPAAVLPAAVLPAAVLPAADDVSRSPAFPASSALSARSPPGASRPLPLICPRHPPPPDSHEYSEPSGVAELRGPQSFPPASHVADAEYLPLRALLPQPFLPVSVHDAEALFFPDFDETPHPDDAPDTATHRS
jgi:hypothetical protein